MIKKYITGALLGILMAGCATTEKAKQTEEIKYEADWESLGQYQVPEWWKNSKFGIYFHWGPYSVPAYETEWYSHHMYNEGSKIRKHHEEKYGSLDKFGYKDFIPMFTGEHFDADEWAKLFKEAGAQFAGPVAEHADGFAMWDSELTHWDAKEMGPKRDIVGEMAKAVKKYDMKFIATYHRHWMYAWYPTWDKSTDAGNPEYEGLYGPYTPKGTFTMADVKSDPLPDKKFNDEWLARLDELMEKYQPDIIWFDNRMDIIDEKHRKQFLANYYNNAQKWGKEVVCTYKFEDMEKGTAVLDLERSRMKDKQPFVWLTDDSVDWKAWCDIDDPKYKSTNRLIDFLVDVVSKNGAVLLNIPPKANGEIPEGVVTRLKEMGQWLSMNGEAIYDTRPWVIYGEGPQEIKEGHLSEHKNKEAVAEDIRFTTNGNNLYAIALDWPKDGKLNIKSLGTDKTYLKNKIKSLQLLGSNKELKWSLKGDGLAIELPKDKPCDHAFVFKMVLDKNVM
ncbi:alpha-L-fucosidase [Flammeovirga aprica]|uniref:alpha-L-fucosidase n=1 Tax=Flammeovirga aprica JL-4 TaxID=694437 RepID=A0A7X9NZF1_9BACT|nr:alpha-L-fucosidase [Flammeovirga aprica]NME66761.1 alpha-L-fucosidase [Flammeovirga aprica JL-4]